MICELYSHVTLLCHQYRSEAHAVFNRLFAALEHSLPKPLRYFRVLARFAFSANIGVAREHFHPKYLVYLVILCFEKRRPKQKHCCSPKIKHFGNPKNLQADYATAR